MRWSICILIFASCSLAQPNGPFLITSVESPTAIGSPLIMIDSAAILHAYYVECDAAEFRVMYTARHARSGQAIAGPYGVFTTSGQGLQLEDLAMNSLGEPALLVVRTDDTRHQLILLHPLDDVPPSVVLLDTTDFMHPYWGGSSFEILAPRFVTVTPELSQIVYWLKEFTLTRIGDFGWCGLMLDWPSVTFVSQPDLLFTVRPVDPFLLGLDTEGVILGRTLGPQSLHLWFGDYSSQRRYLVDSAGGFSEEAEIRCQVANFAGQTFHDGTRVHLRAEHYYNSPTTQFFVTELRDTTCEQLANYTCEGLSSRAVSHPDFGFALSCNSPVGVELLRFDSTGQLPASRGSISWHEEGWEYQTAVSAIGSDGLVTTAWIDHSESSHTQRLAFSSCEWATPLDAHETPAPVPQSVSLSAYPNPFNSNVRIDYELPQASEVELTIHNTLGQNVASLFAGRAQAGTHSVNWSPDVASGVYFVTLASGDFVTSRKVLYIR